MPEIDHGKFLEDMPHTERHTMAVPAPDQILVPSRKEIIEKVEEIIAENPHIERPAPLAASPMYAELLIRLSTRQK